MLVSLVLVSIVTCPFASVAEPFLGFLLLLLWRFAVYVDAAG